MTNQQWQQPPQGWQGYPPPPPPRRNNTGWIVLAAFLVVALVGAGAFLLPRLLTTPQVISHTPTASPPSPQATPATQQPGEDPGATERDFSADDAPAHVGGWVAQPVPEGMSGMYYLADELDDDFGLPLQIVVSNSGMPFDAAIGDLIDPIASSGGRVVCGAAEFAVFDCFIDTEPFGALYASATAVEVPTQDVVAIADAIAALHP